MARAPWHIIGALEDIDDSVFLWESLFKSILDNHIKKRIVKIRDRSLPWMNTEIRKAMNRRYKYLREAHVNPGNNEVWCRYKQQRNKVKVMLRKAGYVSFFQISLKNSALKATHNYFRDCRVHLFRQPFLKKLYTCM